MNKEFRKNQYSFYFYASRHSFGIALRFDKYGIELLFLNIYVGVEW